MAEGTDCTEARLVAEGTYCTRGVWLVTECRLY